MAFLDTAHAIGAIAVEKNSNIGPAGKNLVSLPLPIHSCTSAKQQCICTSGKKNKQIFAA